MAVRLFTHGWDFFTPGRSLCYHQWSRAGRHTFRELPAHIAESTASLHRVRALLTGADPTLFGVYGLGNVRTLADFERFCGVSFSGGVLSERARCGGLPPSAFARDAADSVLALLAARGLGLNSPVPSSPKSATDLDGMDTAGS
jgi:hypothetical protein